QQVRLLTNNPRKIVALEGYGLKIVERVPLVVPPNELNADYLATKRSKLGHMFEDEKG
ncbi:MAG: bifunctional 3,4-dihydroxy-2-butanone-4-phosphate synthase/GTP cyclohydrolase II, partial [Planctomycetia bacterium]|nr:bifunctional 3,4-dihydroxy-2-butanone-4-phosphate synthase/GTP cyclohydrolase II [Planctomycetia bacterium]